MDYAKKILSKYGWKDGDGLGKNNSGIAKPIRANLKFDNAGFGLDRAKEFNDHWWERCFNEAASNVDVTSGNGSVAVALKNSDDSVEISTKGYSQKKLRKAKEQSAAAGGAVYSNFLQCATLTRSGDEVLNDKKINVKEIEVAEVKVLTDEELFLACGGRTAHKGARHGLNLSAKLARLEEQEKQMLANMQRKDAPHMLEKYANEKELEIPKKKKKKKSKENDTSETRDEHCQNYIDTEEQDVIKKKKKKDKRKPVDNEEINDAVNSEANETPVKKKRKKETSKTEDEIIELASQEVKPCQTVEDLKETSREETTFDAGKTKKKKKKNNK